MGFDVASTYRNLDQQIQNLIGWPREGCLLQLKSLGISCPPLILVTFSFYRTFHSLLFCTYYLYLMQQKFRFSKGVRIITIGILVFNSKILFPVLLLYHPLAILMVTKYPCQSPSLRPKLLLGLKLYKKQLWSCYAFLFWILRY